MTPVEVPAIVSTSGLKHTDCTTTYESLCSQLDRPTTKVSLFRLQRLKRVQPRRPKCWHKCRQNRDHH
jgi:hypothetical protein